MPSKKESSTDISSRYIIQELNLRVIHLKLHRSFLQIIEQHAYPKVISKWLGEALICNTLATNLLKFDGRVVMNIKNNNSPLKLLSCKCNNLQEISGLVQWDNTATEKQLAAATLSGELIISIIQQQKEPYQSITSINGKSITETLTDYFNQSEQLPTKIFFTEKNSANLQGLLLQHIPSSNNSTSASDSQQSAEFLKNIDHKMIAALLKTQSDSLTILNKIFPQQSILHLEDVTVTFKCSCNRQRMATALVNIGKQECDSILSQHQIISVECEFCGKDQTFDKQQVEQLWN